MKKQNINITDLESYIINYIDNINDYQLDYLINNSLYLKKIINYVNNFNLDLQSNLKSIDNQIILLEKDLESYILDINHIEKKIIPEIFINIKNYKKQLDDNLLLLKSIEPFNFIPLNFIDDFYFLYYYHMKNKKISNIKLNPFLQLFYNISYKENKINLKINSINNNITLYCNQKNIDKINFLEQFIHNFNNINIIFSDISKINHFIYKLEQQNYYYQKKINSLVKRKIEIPKEIQNLTNIYGQNLIIFEKNKILSYKEKIKKAIFMNLKSDIENEGKYTEIEDFLNFINYNFKSI